MSMLSVITSHTPYASNKYRFESRHSDVTQFSDDVITSKQFIQLKISPHLLLSLYKQAVNQQPNTTNNNLSLYLLSQDY